MEPEFAGIRSAFYTQYRLKSILRQEGEEEAVCSIIYLLSWKSTRCNNRKVVRFESVLHGIH